MKKVFISYSQEGEEHNNRVYKLVEDLRRDGITVIIDQDNKPSGPNKGWISWCKRQVIDCDFVIMIFTETYCRRFEGEEKPGKGLGAVYEGRLIQQEIYNAGGDNPKYRPVIFTTAETNFIPLELQSYQYFQLDVTTGYKNLLSWLQPPAHSSAVTQPQPITWHTPPDNFKCTLADRKEEYKTFKNMVSGQCPERILLLHAVTNSGKTVLLREMHDCVKKMRMHSALIDFKGCPTMDDLFESLKVQLDKAILHESYDATGTGRRHRLLSDITNLAEPLLLIFDTYEQSSTEIQKWIETQLLIRLDQKPALIVVIAGQHIPEKEKHSWGKESKAYDLPPILHPNDWFEYSKAKYNCDELSFEQVKTLTIAAKGNPGMMSMLLSGLVQSLQSQQPSMGA